MNRTRQILITILAFLTLSVIVSIIKISLQTQETQESFTFNVDNTGPGIGVIKIYDVISTSGSSNTFTQLSGSDSIVKSLDNFMQNPKVRAVVIRINSPGGTVSATQEIFQKIMQLRKNNIPVIASMGDISASGGYYISSACDEIYANPGTLTGSIGVVIAAPNFSKLFEEFGIDMNVIKSGKYKDILSSSRSLEEDERELLQTIVDDSYKQFLKDISLGRNIPISDFEEYADGRIFSGTQAREYGLVDQIGSYEDALNRARELAKLKANAPIYYDVANPFDVFVNSLGIKLFNIEHPFHNQKYSIVEYRYIP
jgi:protease-4